MLAMLNEFINFETISRKEWQRLHKEDNAPLTSEELDSIRSFDPVSQRSLGTLDETLIMPRFFSGEADGAILDHLQAAGRVMFDEPARLAETATRLVRLLG